MKKKLTVLLLTVFLTVAWFPIMISAATPISLEATPVQNGTFTVKLITDGSLRWYAWAAQISYDSRVLEAVQVRKGSVITDAVIGDSSISSEKVSLAYICADQSFNSAKSGSVCEVEFRIRSGNQLTKTTTLSLTILDCVDWNGKAQTNYNASKVYSTLTIAPPQDTDTQTGTSTNTEGSTDTRTETDTDIDIDTRTDTDTSTDTEVLVSGSDTNTDTTEDSTSTESDTDETPSDTDSIFSEPGSSDQNNTQTGSLLWIWISIGTVVLAGGGFALWFFLLRKKKSE